MSTRRVSVIAAAILLGVVFALVGFHKWRESAMEEKTRSYARILASYLRWYAKDHGTLPQHLSDIPYEHEAGVTAMFFPGTQVEYTHKPQRIAGRSVIVRVLYHRRCFTIDDQFVVQ